MRSKFTEDAIKIIERAPDHGPLRPLAYADALPPEAGGLAELLRTQEIAGAAKDFHEADGRAIHAQTFFTWIARTAAFSGFLAAVLGGLILYFGAAAVAHALGTVLGVSQIGFLALSLIGSLVLYSFKPFRYWRARRGEAELARVEIYSRIIRAPAPTSDALLLPLKLECFRRHLLEDQQAFFVKRGGEHRKTVRVWTTLRVVALILIVAACVPLLAKFPWLPDAVRNPLARLPLAGPGVQEAYALAGLLGASLQGLLAALAAISLAERNADKYEAMAMRLKKLADDELEGARANAASLHLNEVETFTARITNDLKLEAYDWGVWHEAVAGKVVRPTHTEPIPQIER
jgi:hypothetical protein